MVIVPSHFKSKISYRIHYCSILTQVIQGDNFNSVGIMQVLNPLFTRIDAILLALSCEEFYTESPNLSYISIDDNPLQR
jgi:hypothetical protein